MYEAKTHLTRQREHDNTRLNRSLEQEADESGEKGEKTASGKTMMHNSPLNKVQPVSDNPEYKAKPVSGYPEYKAKPVSDNPEYKAKPVSDEPESKKQKLSLPAQILYRQGQKLWKKDRKDNGDEISFPTQNEALTRMAEIKKKGRWKDYQVNSTQDNKKWWVEVSGPQRIFRIAWTIDDGPSGIHTDEMQGPQGLSGLKQVTWYIQRNKLQGKDAALKKLKKLQDDGGEIAIHSFHATADHSTWFPIAAKYVGSAYSAPYEGKTEDDIMKDLLAFNDELKKYGIKPKFARLPGGLTSELTLYAKTLGLKDDGKIKEIKNGLLAKKDVSSKGTEAAQMQKDFKTLKDKLSELDLMEWSGTQDPFTIAAQSWQSETSGVRARSDVTTYKISPGASYDPKTQKGTLPGQAGIYEKKLDEMEANNLQTGSLVILAHDSTLADAQAVAEDKKEIERLAEIRGVTVIYETMSSLFKDVTGKDPSTLDVKY